VKPNKITWLFGALSFAERHEMTADERIAAEQRAAGYAGPEDHEVIVTVADTIFIVARRPEQEAA
jgi:hypothetical protein